MKEKQTPFKKAQKIELLRRAIADPNLNPDCKERLETVLFYRERNKPKKLNLTKVTDAVILE